MKSECRFVRFKRFCQRQYPEYTRYNMYRCGLATEELDFEKLLDRRPLALAPRPTPPATHQRAPSHRTLATSGQALWPAQLTSITPTTPRTRCRQASITPQPRHGHLLVLR